MSIELDIQRLSQQQNLNELQRNYQLTEMIPVYLAEEDNYLYDNFIHAVLVPQEHTDSLLDSSDWDLLFGMNDKTRDGLRTVVLHRNFDGIKPCYRELIEEFRLFHNLFHDRTTGKYIKINDNGDEVVVAIDEENKFSVRLREIREFLTAKKMCLSLQFDYRVFSNYSLEELGLTSTFSENISPTISWMLSYGADPSSNHNSFSMLNGKRLILPFSKKSGNHSHEKKFAEFIIKTDEDGSEITHSSNPKLLASHFNPNAPHYLTGVHFRKQVLDKYYQYPNKYLVQDSLLSCGSLWSLEIDNHHDDKVCVWLGDLGRDIPYEEQLYWRAYNIPPVGKISATYYKRQLLCEFADSSRIEDVFESCYAVLQESCDQYLGWQLLLPLADNDAYHLKGIRIPPTNEQKGFDELVLGITKVLIDSLNENKLKTFLSEEEKKLVGSINKLQAVFKHCDVATADEHISFLRQLQELRSACSAHRKGDKYNKSIKNFGEHNLNDIFKNILGKSVSFLKFLIEIVQNGKFATSSSAGISPPIS